MIRFIFIFIYFHRDFERLDHEDEVEPEEPEIRISREELLSRYQVCSLFFLFSHQSIFLGGRSRT